MMTTPVSIIILTTTLLINTLSYCSAEKVHCVTPTANSCSSCPHNLIHCATLSEYAQNAEMYFTSATTMVFLPGDHVLDRNITVANVARLTMHGGSSSGNIATVVRNGSVGFSFTNMVDFNIYSLAFTSYNRSLSYGSHPASNSALLLQSIKYAKLVNCSFHNNLGTALTVDDTNVVLVENKFIHNQCACRSFSKMRELGCGITTFDSKLIFTGNTSFHKNTQTASCPSVNPAGAIWASASSLHFDGTNNFFNNSANGNTSNGGAIYAETNTLLSFSGTSNFIYNSADVGGAIGTSNNVTLVFNGISNFINNIANSYGGGAIYPSKYSNVTFNGINNFTNNSAEGFGGAIVANNHTILNFNGTNIFLNNSVGNGGAVYAYDYVKLAFNGTNNFTNNSAAEFGGAIYTDNVILTFKGSNNFINNLAHNTSGGAIHAVINTTMNFIGTSIFSHNSASYEGGAVVTAHNVVLTFTGTSNFFNNSATTGGAIFAVVNASLNFGRNTNFSSNFATQGGAISANSNSKLSFDGNVRFTNNGHNTRESHGGAIHLAISSTFSLSPHTTVHWENNHANLGGAISVLNANPLIYCTVTRIAKYLLKEKCFFQILGQKQSSGLDVQLIFKNNSADTAGSVLYGGAVDNCTLIGLESYNSSEVFHMLVQIEGANTTSNISSDPFHLCPCENNHPDCSKKNKELSVYPGETFQVSVVAVGQRDGIVPAQVISHVDKGRLVSSQYVQQTTKMCTTLNYTVFSKGDVTLELYPDGPCTTVSDKLLLQLSIHQSCLPGFSLKNSSMSCVCDQAIQEYTNCCNITNGLGQIKREFDDTFWVGYDQFQEVVVVHPHCPFFFCVSNTVVFPLNSTLSDIQCDYNRSGLLCGACKKGYSLVLGTFECRKCSNNHLALVIPFAVMGVALVFLLFVCKLTVATGTLSGLVFYANVVGVNRTIFLPVESTDALSVFIAWINLDFGIETCFYDRMDAYSKTWLQFVFPVYLWMLVGFVILVSHYSKRFANLLGSNPVSVLATLILLSYAKILRTLFTAVYFTQLKYPMYKRRVWLYDANIDYLVGKHIPLFLVAILVFLFLFLPYTLLLLFGQWLQAISHLRLFSWINRLKPFMDSYHAPYKPKHRYWPGLLLVLRIVLYLRFVFNRERDPSINLLEILVGTGILHLWAWISGGVYKNWCLDALEGSFALNLIILGISTYHIKLSGGNQLAVGYTSINIALATFIGILAYHIFQQLRHTKLWKKVPKLNLKLRKLHKKLNTKKAVNNPVNDPTVSVNLDQLREPWLEDLLQSTHSSL